MTPEEKIRALSAALARLTHHPRLNPHPCIAKDCAMHPDAAVHHTPARVLGLSPDEGGTPRIGRPYEGAIEDAVTLIATSVNAGDKQRHPGWGCYLPSAHAAVMDLVAAGWTPPGGGEADERLRCLVADLETQIRQLGEALSRQYAETVAAKAFREKFLGIWFQLQEGLAARDAEAQVAGEPPPMYESGQILQWMHGLLDRSTNTADKAEKKSLAEQREAAPKQTVQDVPVQETLL